MVFLAILIKIIIEIVSLTVIYIAFNLNISIIKFAFLILVYETIKYLLTNLYFVIQTRLFSRVEIDSLSKNFINLGYPAPNKYPDQISIYNPEKHYGQLYLEAVIDDPDTITNARFHAVNTLKSITSYNYLFDNSKQNLTQAMVNYQMYINKKKSVSSNDI